MLRTLLMMIVFVPSLVWAQSSELELLSNPTASPLSSEQAFIPTTHQANGELLVRFDVARGYKLYRHKIDVASQDVVIGEWTLPEGVEYDDPEFGTVDVFAETVEFKVPIKEAKAAGTLTLYYQGCSTSLCYPPQTKTVKIKPTVSKPSLSDNKETESREVEGESSTDTAQPPQAYDLYNVWQYAVFFALGIGLGFTPCVFPMYPIMSSVVIAGATGVKRTGVLALSYVQGMAVVYSLVGVMVAILGAQFQAFLQHPAVLGSVIFLFLILAGSLFGFYTLQLPSSYQNKLNSVSQRQTGGTVVKSFGMGAVSGMVASPCTTAPLAGILLFIAQTGDVAAGFLSLYVLSLGMGIPLILFAITGGKLLPRSGAWMNIVKHLLGFAMLAVAIMFIDRIVTEVWVTLLTAVLLFALSCYSHFLSQTLKAQAIRSVAFTLFIMLAGGSLLMVGNALGLNPSTLTSKQTAQSKEEFFLEVKNKKEWERVLVDAEREQRWVMLDFYAKWCSACIQYEKETFSSEKIQEQLSDVIRIKVDASEGGDFAEWMQTRYQVIGMPTILWFSPKKREAPQARITGFLEADEFSKRIAAIRSGRATD